jgi:hypothetical protein
MNAMRAPTLARTGARSLLRHLEAGGWTEREASNLIALSSGLRPTADGWSIREIEHLKFLKAMVKNGRISG